jgi:hypothetical protein
MVEKMRRLAALNGKCTYRDEDRRLPFDLSTPPPADMRNSSSRNSTQRLRQSIIHRPVSASESKPSLLNGMASLLQAPSRPLSNLSSRAAWSGIVAWVVTGVAVVDVGLPPLLKPPINAKKPRAQTTTIPRPFSFCLLPHVGQIRARGSIQVRHC